MRGTLRDQKNGVNRMRVGYADSRFSITILLASLFIMLLFAWWAYWEFPDTKWRPVFFLCVYIVAVALYANLGVWLHEKLHCLAFRRTPLEKKTQISFSRKYILVLSGHYRVEGEIDYWTMRRALLAPLGLVGCLVVAGFIGSLFLPGWWLPLLMSMAVAGVLDMTHDLYWISEIRQVGAKGKFWDYGNELLAVWQD